MGERSGHVETLHGFLAQQNRTHAAGARPARRSRNPPFPCPAQSQQACAGADKCKPVPPIVRPKSPSVSQARRIVPASVSRFRPMKSRPTADKCEPLHLWLRLNRPRRRLWPRWILRQQPTFKQFPFNHKSYVVICHRFMNYIVFYSNLFEYSSMIKNVKCPVYFCDLMNEVVLFLRISDTPKMGNVIPETGAPLRKLFQPHPLNPGRNHLK